MFFDHRLNLLPDYTDIVWENAVFDTNAKLSQLVYFLKNKFPSDQKICIIDHISQVFDCVNTVNDSDMDLVIINASDHPLQFDDIHAIKKPKIKLDFDFNKHDYHPWHILWSHWLANRDNTVDFTSPRQHDISCLYVKSRITRVYNITQLHQRSYFDKIYTVWCDKFETPEQLMHEDGLTADDVRDCWQTYLSLEKGMPEIHLTEFESCQILGKGYEDTYLNIVLEARIADFGFLTEKICKPIRAGQLFLTQSSPGTIRYLRSIGFDTFDDYIDHDRYDLELDWKKRTRLIHTVLDEIQPRLPEIFAMTVERRQRNAEWLKNPELVTRLLKTAKVDK